MDESMDSRGTAADRYDAGNGVNSAVELGAAFKKGVDTSAPQGPKAGNEGPQATQEAKGGSLEKKLPGADKPDVQGPSGAPHQDSTGPKLGILKI